MERRKDNQDLVLQKLSNKKIRHAVMGQYEPFFFFLAPKDYKKEFVFQEVWTEM